ncbi:MAG TPA: penicillin acylase family protein [Thermoleophilaceae bacterium]|nr:penicillin acylase family protein [Thermoleophilaceae bacterium]
MAGARKRHLVLACALAAFAVAPAQAKILQAESVLPPGQSGYVSVPGVVAGTGSPHLNDQTSLFTSFGFKSALFNQPGRAEVPKAGVRIVRDRYGVPAITGSSDTDAWWGAGYAVAQDRLFQLELFRRATSGRLAEILGDTYLDDDLIARRDYYTDPELDAMLARIPVQLRRRAEAYRDGVNAWSAKVRSDPSLLPGEFAALGATPPTWTLRDTARVGVFLARTVPSSDGREIENARALRELGPTAFAKLLPLRTNRAVPTVPPSSGYFASQPGRTLRQERSALGRSQRWLRGVPLPAPKAEASASASSTPRAAVIPRGGSYMWAIGRPARKARKCRTVKRRGRKARRRCRTAYRRPKRPGNAYLFNGPQLGYSVPELFVELELHSPTQNMRGVTAAGIPVLGIGHNGHLAWGFTSGLSDEDDLYAETLAGRESYRHKGATRPMDCRTERFDFKAPVTDLPDLIGSPGRLSGTRTERICRTLHGPVQERAGGTAYARRYAIWGRELETIVGLSKLNDARTVRQADGALQGVTWNENVMAADERGDIGFWHPGLHPLRPRGYDERLPYPGTGEAEWRGLLDRRKTPYVINPRQGYLFNWNNIPSAGWTAGDSEATERLAGPYHRARLLKLLVSRAARRPSYAASRAIDRTSGSTAQQRPLFGKRLRLARRGAGGGAAAVLDTLLRWDGNYTRTNGRGTVPAGVATWEEFKDRAEAIGLFALNRRRPGQGTISLAGKPGTSHEFDISNGEAYALRTLSPSALRLAASRTAAELTKRFKSSSPSAWREPRRMYEVTAQGAADTPELPFFDRGTWQQSVGLGP